MYVSHTSSTCATSRLVHVRVGVAYVAECFVKWPVFEPIFNELIDRLLNNISNNGSNRIIINVTINRICYY